MFKMKLPLGPVIGAVVILLLGIAAYGTAQQDPGDLPAHDRGKLALSVSIIIAGMLMILATGRMWYAHLWHDRYRKTPWSKSSKKPIKRK